MCYLTQGMLEVSGRELRKHLFTHFQFLQANFSDEDHGDQSRKLGHARLDVQRAALVQTIHSIIPTQVGL